MPKPATRKHSMRHIVSQATSMPWAIRPETLDEIRELIALRDAGEEFTEDEIRERISGRYGFTPLPDASLAVSRGDDSPPAYHLTSSGVAIVPLMGVLGPRMNMMTRISGGTSTQQFSAAMRQAAADKDVRGILIRTDSPGGVITGTPEAAATVREVAARKPVVSYVEGWGTSAGYWIPAAATKVFAGEGSYVGSVGVYRLHVETSKADATAGRNYTLISAGRHKVDANSYEPLSDQGRATLQEGVDDAYAMFVSAVAKYRGVSTSDVENGYGQGKYFLAPKALARGLIDGVRTIEQAVAEVAEMASAGGRATPASSVSSQEVQSMDKIKAALVARGVIGNEANEEAVQAALSAWFAARGQTAPKEEAAILAALEAKPAAAQPAPTPPATPPAQPAEPATGNPQPPTQTAEDRRREEQIRAEERNRVETIRARGELLSVPQSMVQDAIDTGMSAEQFAGVAIDHTRDTRQPVGQIEPQESSHDRFRDQALACMAVTADIATDEDRQVAGRSDLQYASLLSIAEQSLRMHAGGRRMIGDQETIAAAALGSREAMVEIFGASVPYQSPGDFPNILSAMASKALERAPQYVGTTFQHWCYKRAALPDFKPASLVRFGEFGEMPLHIDGDDFEQSSISEDYSWIAVDSYGDEFGLTPVMIVNDDLGAFMDALRDKNNAHDQTLNTLCVNLLTGNVACLDGYSLFDNTNHGNDITSGAAPNTTQLSAMRLKLRQQTGVGGRRKLNWTLRRLLIPEALETTTQQLLSATLQINPTQESATPVFKGQVAWDVEPKLTDNSATIYYGFMDPSVARTIVYCHQRGYERMKRRSYYNPQNNCRIFQFEGRFAAGINNYRGIVRNAGA